MQLKSLPVSDQGSLFDILFTQADDKYQTLFNRIISLVVPVVILTIQPCIITILKVSEQIAITANQNYIKVISIREQSSFKMLINHLLPNTIPVIIPQLAYHITILLSSTMVIEIIFDRVGLGSWTVIALYQHNYSVIALAILGVGSLISLLILLSELFVIIFYPMQYRRQYE